MGKIKNFLAILLICMCTLHASEEQFTSRFVLTTDEATNRVAGFSLPSGWWSRPYEYAWASTFAGAKYEVLDAACGVSHPFKWLLGTTCKKAWACDIDVRLVNEPLLKQEIRDDLGAENYTNFVENPSLRQNVQLILQSICNLSDPLPQFDRIFCISTLEHMTAGARKLALSEFARKLKVDGLVVITMDYPLVEPEELLKEAEKVGLIPAGKVERGPPPKNAIRSDTAIPNGSLFVYRCVLKNK